MRTTGKIEPEGRGDTLGLRKTGLKGKREKNRRTPWQKWWGTSFLACAVAFLLIGAAPAAANQKLVALGDSFSSGTGTAENYANDCKRTWHAYGNVVGRERPNTDTHLVACNGSVTADVRQWQVDWLSGTTDWVTITIGGNDAQFSDIMFQCALPWSDDNCWDWNVWARDFIRSDAFEWRLHSTYGRIRDNAPNAKGIIVLGYPKIFTGTNDCNAGTAFSADEIQWINRTAEILGEQTQQEVARMPPKFHYKGAIGQFQNHGVCAEYEWINGLSEHGNSYHPNIKGHDKGYAPLVREVTG